MANEITVSGTIGLANTNLTVPDDTYSDNYTQTTERAMSDTQTIPTTAGGTVVDFGNVTDVGQVKFKNLSGTLIELGPDSGGSIVPLIKIQAGKSSGPFELTTNTMRAIATTSSVELHIIALDE
jgi:hypothetical protein